MVKAAGMDATPAWSEVRLDPAMYRTYVEPIHQIDEVAEPWIDHPKCRIEIEQTGSVNCIRSHFRVYGCSAPKVLACMYDETERQKIDSTLVRFCRVASIDADTDVVYHHSRFPLGVLQQRDAVVWRHRLEHNTEQHQYTVMWVSCTHPDHPPRPDILRIQSSGCYRILQSGDDVDVYSLVHSDMKGAIPTKVVRMATLPSVLACRHQIEKACQSRQA